MPRKLKMSPSKKRTSPSKKRMSPSKKSQKKKMYNPDSNETFSTNENKSGAGEGEGDAEEWGPWTGAPAPAPAVEGGAGAGGYLYNVYSEDQTNYTLQYEDNEFPMTREEAIELARDRNYMEKSDSRTRHFVFGIYKVENDNTPMRGTEESVDDE